MEKQSWRKTAFCVSDLEEVIEMLTFLMAATHHMILGPIFTHWQFSEDRQQKA